MRPQFSAEHNPDVIHVLPVLCWMRMETEDGRPAGTLLQIAWLTLTAQWLWD